jgi:hypothetical protein
MFLALDRNVVLKEPNAKRILHVLSILNQTDHLIGITGYEAQGIVDFDKFHFLSLFLSAIVYSLSAPSSPILKYFRFW